MEDIFKSITDCYRNKCSNPGILYLTDSWRDLRVRRAESETERAFDETLANLINAAINLQETR
jgi:hypothetical protein